MLNQILPPNLINPATVTKMERFALMPAYAYGPAISIDIAFESSAVKRLN
jgi:hypothetical protein